MAYKVYQADVHESLGEQEELSGMDSVHPEPNE